MAGDEKHIVRLMTPKEHAIYLLGLATGKAFKLRDQLLQTNDEVKSIIETLLEAKDVLMKVEE